MFFVKTDFPVACDSPDHLRPLGTRIDNNTNVKLIEEMESFFPGRKILSLDLGCSGGQFVVDQFNRGHRALGIEGSNYSITHKRANWPEFHGKLLFTADLTKPFEIFTKGKPARFDVITAWEVLEHLKPEDLQAVLTRIEALLDDDGVFFGSIAVVECVFEGVRLHQSVFPKETWFQEILAEHFAVVPYPFKNAVNELWEKLGESFFFMGRKKKVRKLNLGCGGNRIPGWENHDAEVDISKRLPFADSSFNFILAEHVLEHIHVQQGYRFFEEAYRTLKPGGVLRLCVPGIDRIFQGYNDEYGRFIESAGFGTATRKGAVEAILFNHGHQSSWTRELLAMLLQAVGFKTEDAEPKKSRHEELRNVDGHWQVIGEAHNRLETIVMEAAKPPLMELIDTAVRNPGKKQQVGIGLIEHMGDIVACEPVSRYLREHHPEAEITWVLRHEYRELVDSNPHVDNTLIVNCLSDWIRVTESTLFDHVVDLHVNRRVCTVWGTVLQKKTGNPDVDVEKYFHYGSLLEAFCRGAGLPPLQEGPRVYIPDSAKQKVDTLALPTTFITMHGISNETCKDWPANKWMQLFRSFCGTTGIPVVEVGSRPICGPLSEDREAQYINLCGKLTILETAEVIRRSSLFVGIDSGPGHLANAVGTHGVILLGAYRIFSRYLPYSGDYANGKKAELLYSEKGPAASLPVEKVLHALLKHFPGVRRKKAVMTKTQESVSTGRSRNAPDRESTPKLIAIYLPQFHPIPENDEWWGKGFTEWTNVAKAGPLFQGHYQPHRPRELGFCDLRLPEVRKAQADLAREHGIHGFCYYHYWFNGKLLLERPLQEVLKSGEPDFPFCLCWANENWTRAWDGGENHILMEQRYSEEDDLAHIRHLCEIFRDSRYIRIGGKPLFLVYRANRFPDPLKTSTLWREEARRLGIGEICLCRVESFPDEHTDPKMLGFDAAVEFQPDWTQLSHDLRDERIPDLTAFQYEKVVDRMLEKERPPYTRFPCVTPSWDNTPRRKRNALFFTESSPAQYGRWLRGVLEKLEDRGEEGNLVFINAWNEWGEGNHLEPDEKFGRAYLETTKSALDGARIGGRNPAVEAHEGILKLFISAGKRAEAVFALEKLVESYPDYAPAHNDLGVLHGETGNLERALASYEKAVSLDPGNVTFQKNLADFLYVAMKMPDEALRHYEKALSLNPRDTETLLIMGNIRVESGYFREAQDYYLRVLEMDPSNELAGKMFDALEARRNDSASATDSQELLRKARALAQRGQTDRAIGKLEILLQACPDHGMAHNDLGFLYFGKGDREKALAHYEKAVALNPDDPTSLKNLADCYLVHGGRRQDALKLYTRALQERPNDVEALKAIGLICVQLERFEDACSFFHTVLGLDPTDIDAILSSGHVHAAIGRFEVAEAFYRKAIDLDPGNANARLGLEYIGKERVLHPAGGSLQGSSLLTDLLTDQPKFHNDGEGHPISWNANVSLLNFLDAHLQPKMHTLETGSGYSTVLFVGKQCNHTAITPAQIEFDRISEYCKGKNLPLDRARFIAKDSVEHLPLLNGSELDVLFIDGAHRFPFPILDWFYGSKLLKQGGIAIVDDTDIITCFILLKFLEQDSHWEAVLIEKDFAVFRKLAGHDYAGDWPGQMFSKNKIRGAETFTNAFFNNRSGQDTLPSAFFEQPDARETLSLSAPERSSSAEEKAPKRSPVRKIDTTARENVVFATEGVEIDWTQAFDYQKLTKEELEEYSSIEVTKDLREGGIHAQKAWGYWFRYLSENAWGTSLSKEIISFCNAIDHPRILSLGCGYGGVELGIAQCLNRPYEIIAVDINGHVLARAREEAKSKGFDIRFLELDLNFVNIRENTFDLIFAHASLHHLLNLEHVFYQIYKGLKHKGRLIIQDIIGKTQVLFWRKNVDFAIEVVEKMPARYKSGISNQHAIIAPYVEPSIQKGMEGIRQEDIPTQIDKYFAPVRVFKYGSFMRMICTHPELGKRLDPDKKADREYLERLFRLDLQQIEESKLRPTEMLAVYERRASLDCRKIHAEAHLNLGGFLLHRGDKDQAVRHFENALALDPDNHAAQRNLAAASSHRHQSTQPEETITKTPPEVSGRGRAQGAGPSVSIMNPRNESPLPINTGIGGVLQNANCLNHGAPIQFKKGEIYSREAVDTFERIHKHYIAKGKFPEACLALVDFLKRYPDFSRAHNDLGYLYYQQGEKGKAVACYEKAVEIDPRNITFLKNLADFYFAEAGRLEDAVKIYHGILADHPDDVEALFAFGQVCVKLNRPEDAAPFFKKVLALEPGHETAGEMLTALERKAEETATGAEPFVSIIIPSGREPDLVSRAIGSIIHNTEYPRYEILVASSRTTGGAENDFVSCERQKIRLSCISSAGSAAAALNAAARKATGNHLLFIDPRLVLSKGWLNPLLRTVQAHPGFGAVSPKIIDPPATILEAGFSRPENGTVRGHGEGEAIDRPELDYCKEVPSSSRFLTLLPKKTWEACGGFDERIEDFGLAMMDLGLSVRKIGRSVFYQPLAVAGLVGMGRDDANGQKQVVAGRDLIERLRPQIVQHNGEGKGGLKGEQKRILVLGVYLASKLNTADDIAAVLSGAGHYEVDQRWVALGGPAPTERLKALTSRTIMERTPKFRIMNELLSREDLTRYEYVLMTDDDVVMPDGFLDSFIGLQEKLGFAIAQPARTVTSYVDHPIVIQQWGVLARETMFVEIGPVVSFHRSVYGLVFPFDTASPMGWGYENVWSYLVREKKMKMGIIDNTPVDHSIRKPVENYDWQEADAQRTHYLERNTHTPLADCFTTLRVFNLEESNS